MAPAILESDVGGALPLLTRGKVRDLYEVDANTLLFVATDRISAYDVNMQNPIPDKGILLTRLTAHWIQYLTSALPHLHLHTHLLTLSLPPPTILPPPYRTALEGRSMQVRRLRIFPLEAIVRGYVTGSAWREYTDKGTVHGIAVPPGLRESEAFPEGPIYTPSTKAEAGAHDENVHPDRAVEIVGPKYAARIAQLSLALYTAAHEHALARGLIIADTKFEFGLDETTDEVVLVDEALTPDSSRFWARSTYMVGRGQESFDKQFLRDWLVRKGLKGKKGVIVDEEVVARTREKYVEAFERITESKFGE